MRSFAAVKNPREGAEPRPYASHGSILHRADRGVRLYNRFRNISVGRADHSLPLIIHRTPFKNTCHCEAGANAGRGNPHLSSPSFRFLLFFHENSLCFFC